jgi:hypothetical protein
MNKGTVFSLDRFLALLNIELNSIKKPGLITAAAIGGFVFLTSLNFTNQDPAMHMGNFALFLMLGGLIFTSYSFKELKENTSGMSWLLIPGSHFEKFMVKLLVASAGFIVGITCVYYLGMFLGETVNALILKSPHQYLDIFSWDFLNLIGGYLLMMSFYVFGAIYFKSYHFIKTSLALFAVFLLFGVVILAIAYLVFLPYFDGLSIKPEYKEILINAQRNSGHVNGYQESHFQIGGNLPVFNYIMKAWMNFVTPIVVLIASYLKITEKQV